MSKLTDTNQEMTRYLLGALAEAETERFDELSFTDNEFAAALNAAEKDLVDAYVQGELTGETLEQFNNRYLASPLRREKVTFAQGFQVFAEKSAHPQAEEVQAESPAKTATNRKSSAWLLPLSLFSFHRPALRWGLAAATLALMVVGSWLVFKNSGGDRQLTQPQAQQQTPPDPAPQPQKQLDDKQAAKAAAEQDLARVREEGERQERELSKRRDQARVIEQQRAAKEQPASPARASIASFILTPQRRGVGQAPILAIPAKTDYVGMQLQLESNDYPTYRVALIDPSNNQALWRAGNIKAGGNGKSLNVRFRASLLKPQAYILQVSGVPPTAVPEIVGDYPFRVIR